MARFKVSRYAEDMKTLLAEPEIWNRWAEFP